jgi:hypothetical protein
MSTYWQQKNGETLVEMVEPPFKQYEAAEVALETWSHLKI